LVIWRRPWKTSTLPNNPTRDPSASWRARQPWLKNVTFNVAVPSLTVASTIALPLRVRRLVTRRTSPTTDASSPGSSESTSARWRRSW
jgi:hypothetical protein